MASHWVKFTVIFIIASGLILTAVFLSWYPSSRIESLETRLNQSGLTQAEIDWIESSLIWWRSQGVFTYGSASNFVLLGGILVLAYAISYILLSNWRASARAKRQNISEVKWEAPEVQLRAIRTGFPIVSGVLTIIASSLVMLFSGIFVVGGFLTISSRLTTQGVNLLFDGVFGIVVFAFSLTGGIMTLKRKNFIFAIISLSIMVVKGATFIIATGEDFLGTYVGIAILVLTVLSLIFTSISYKEFS
jgi:hypothetical protein